MSRQTKGFLLLDLKVGKPDCWTEARLTLGWEFTWFCLQRLTLQIPEDFLGFSKYEPVMLTNASMNFLSILSSVSPSLFSTTQTHPLVGNSETLVFAQL